MGDHEGRLVIDWVKLVVAKPGPFVTNSLSAAYDLDDDGFLTAEDNWVYGTVIEEFFSGPHAVTSVVDHFFDSNGNHFVSLEEIEKAADILIVKALRFSRDKFKYACPQQDYTNDGLLNDDDILEIKKLVLRFPKERIFRSRLVSNFWWLPLPDFLLQPVPRKVENYLDSLADYNGDGVIDYGEQEIIETTFGLDSVEQNYLFKSLDRNRDNNLGWNELNLVLQISAKGTNSLGLTPPPYPCGTPVDKMLDASGDDFLDEEEIQNVVRLFSRENLDMFLINPDLLKTIDTDSDDELSFAERERFKADYFYPRETDRTDPIDRQSDVNGDGYVDVAEIGVVAGYASGIPIIPLDVRMNLWERREVSDSHRQKKTESALSAHQFSDKNVAVINVETILSGMDERIGFILSSFIENALLKIDGFKLVERRRIDTIVDEIKWQYSGMVSEDTAIEMGKMVGAEIIAQGLLTEIAGTYYLNLKFIQVETSEIIASSIATTKDPDDFLRIAEDVAYSILSP